MYYASDEYEILWFLIFFFDNFELFIEIWLFWKVFFATFMRLKPTYLSAFEYFFRDFSYHKDYTLSSDVIWIENLYWTDIWEFDTKISSLENQIDLPWNMYYKYKLSMFNTWHVLEDRISVFFLFIILCL